MGSLPRGWLSICTLVAALGIFTCGLYAEPPDRPDSPVASTSLRADLEAARGAAAAVETAMPQCLDVVCPGVCGRLLQLGQALLPAPGIFRPAGYQNRIPLAGACDQRTFERDVVAEQSGDIRVINASGVPGNGGVVLIPNATEQRRTPNVLPAGNRVRPAAEPIPINPAPEVLPIPGAPLPHREVDDPRYREMLRNTRQLELVPIDDWL